MPEEKPLLLTDLACQDECNPEEVLDTLKSYVESGSFINLEWIEDIFEKTPFGDEHFSLMYRYMANGTGDEGISSFVRMSYKEVANFLKERFRE